MNKKLEKILSACLVTTLCLSFVGCAKSTNNVDVTTIDEQQPVVNKTIIINNISDLTNNSYNIGCQSSSISEDWLNTYTTKATISTYRTNESLINALTNGGVDVVLTDLNFAQNLTKNNSQVKINSAKFQTEKIAFAFKKGEETLRLSVNEAIRSYQNDGTIVELLDIYMPLTGDIVLPDKKTYNNDYTTTIKVGTSSDFAPFEYYDDNVLYGFDITLIEMIADYNSWNVEFVDMHFNELIPALENDEIDIIASGLSITNERYDVLDFSESYYTSEQVILTRK